MNFSVAARYPDIRILEYSGLDRINPVDVVKTATGTNATSNSGAVTTTNANDLLFAANLVQTSTRAAGTGFTSRIITSPDGDIAEDRIVSAVGSYSATAPLTSAGAWIMQMVAFKAAPNAPDLTITKTHSGNFTQGQTGATYTLTVSNVGAVSTSGTVTVTDTLPAGLTATALLRHGLDLYAGNAHLHPFRRAGGFRELPGDHPDGERGGQRAGQRDEHGDRVGGRRNQHGQQHGQQSDDHQSRLGPPT